MMCTEHKENIKEYKRIHGKIYYEKHKEYILHKNTCSICGGSYATLNLKNHQKTKRHNKCIEIMNNYKKKIDAVINEFTCEKKNENI